MADVSSKYWESHWSDETTQPRQVQLPQTMLVQAAGWREKKFPSWGCSVQSSHKWWAVAEAYSATRVLGFMGNKNRINPSNKIPGSQVKVVMHSFIITLPTAAVCLLTWGRISIQNPAAFSLELSYSLAMPMTHGWLFCSFYRTPNSIRDDLFLSLSSKIICLSQHLEFIFTMFNVLPYLSLMSEVEQDTITFKRKETDVREVTGLIQRQRAWCDLLCTAVKCKGLGSFSSFSSTVIVIRSLGLVSDRCGFPFQLWLLVNAKSVDIFCGISKFNFPLWFARVLKDPTHNLLEKIRRDKTWVWRAPARHSASSCWGRSAHWGSGLGGIYLGCDLWVTHAALEPEGGARHNL